LDREKYLKSTRGSQEIAFRGPRVPNPIPSPRFTKNSGDMGSAGGPLGSVRGPMERATRLASSLAASTQRLASSISKMVSSTSSLTNTQEKESREHETRSFYLSLVSNAKAQTRHLEATSEAVRKILSEVSRIRKVLEDWYERRNQISLRDLISGATRALGSLLRVPQGALGLAKWLLAPLASYLFGRILPNVFRGARPGVGKAPSTGGVLLGGTRDRGARGGPTTRERISRIVGRTRERISRTLERIPGSVTVNRGASVVRKLGERAISLGKEGVGLASKVVGAGLRGLSRLVPVVALAGLGYDLFKNYQESRENFERGLGGSLKALGSSAISTLSLGLIPPEVSSRFVAGISEVLGELVKSISDKLKGFFSRISKSITDGYRSIKERVSQSVDEVKKWTSSGVDFVLGVLSSFKESISETVSQVSSWISERISSVKETINSGVEGLKSLVSRISDIPSEIVGKVSSWFSDKAFSGLNLASEMSSKIKDFVSGVVHNMTSGISSFFEGVRSFFTDLGKRFTSDPIGTIKSIVVGFKDIINSIVNMGPSGGAGDSQAPAPAPAAARKPDVGFIPVRSIAAQPGEPGSLPSIGPSSDLVGVYQNLVRRSVGDYPVTQLIGQNKPYYDSRGNLVNPMGYGKYGHMGIDVATPVGTPVRAPFSGVVVDASGGPWGKSVYLIGKNVAVRFSHLSSIEVPSGSVVAAGQVIAKTGNTGNSTGPHLDITTYTARDGKVGSWVSSYQVINRLVSAEISGKPLSEKELKELQAKVKENLPKVQQVSTDSSQVPISSSVGLALQNLAQSAATLLGLDPSQVGDVLSAIRKRMSDFAGYLENLNRGRIVDIRESEEIIRRIIGTPERFHSSPMIRTGVEGFLPLDSGEKPAKAATTPKPTPSQKSGRKDAPKLPTPAISDKKGNIPDIEKLPKKGKGIKYEENRYQYSPRKGVVLTVEEKTYRYTPKKDEGVYIYQITRQADPRNKEQVTVYEKTERKPDGTIVKKREYQRVVQAEGRVDGRSSVVFLPHIENDYMDEEGVLILPKTPPPSKPQSPTSSKAPPKPKTPPTPSKPQSTTTPKPAPTTTTPKPAPTTTTPKPAPTKAPPAPRPKPEGKPGTVTSAPPKTTVAPSPPPRQDNLSGYLDRSVPLSPTPMAGTQYAVTNVGATSPITESVGVGRGGDSQTISKSQYQAQVQSLPTPMGRINPTVDLKYTPTNPPQVNITPPSTPGLPMATTPGHIGTGAKTTSNESIQELLLINTLLG